MRRADRAAGVLVVKVLLIGLLWGAFAAVPAAAGETPRVAVPEYGASLTVRLGLKDKEPTNWDGSISVSTGRLVKLAVPKPRTGTAAEGSWKLKSVPFKQVGRRSDHDPKAPKLVTPDVIVTLDAPPLAATIKITTPKGDFSFALSDLKLGEPANFLDGQAEVERMPFTVQLTSGPDDEDWPAAAMDAYGAAWLAYVAYAHALPLDVAKIHAEKEFDALLPTGHGDQIFVRKFLGTSWDEPIAVTEPGRDVWRPSVAVDRGSATVWVVWSEKRGNNWDLFARSYPGPAGGPTAAVRLTDAPGADMNPVALTFGNSGRVYVVWQGWRDGSLDVLLTSIGKDGLEPERRLADSPANEWWPTAAFDSTGKLFVAYDTYAAGNYDVKLVADAAGENPRTIDVAASPLFEARPSIVVDREDRVWVAYEEAGQQWGKDTGMRWEGRRGEQLYWRREIVLRAVEGDRVRQAAGRVPCEPIRRNYPDAQTRRMSGPRLHIDGQDRLWLTYRRHPNNTGGGEIWTSWLTHHTGDGWAQPIRLAHSENLMDNRPALIWAKSGGPVIVHSTDGRTSGTRSAKQNDLYCTRVSGPVGAAVTPKLGPLPSAPKPAEVVHPNEGEDVRRIRDYRATVGGKTYQLLRGEFHRHTELTSHRDMDGTLQDMFRYAMDAARMDWIGNGDHDNGYGVEYLWWMAQKRTDMFHHPPSFLPMFTYERSVTYPSGHRNAMFAYRGVRPLPRIPGGKEQLYGTPEAGSPDIKTFYAYLKHFDGICASHTSGTNMGTDWRDHDPEVEPIVEIYQGLRHNYEHQGAPGSAEGPADAIGGYRPAGFVWNALMKGHRLGFQSSSDHYSAHISYAVVYAEEPTREGILDGFKRRHSYGANDNIILDVRSGEQMMGDVFTVEGKPQLEIRVIGTDKIARLSIIRGTGDDAPRYVYDVEPNKQEVELTWTDQAPEPGKTSYYYVRVEQVKPKQGYGALAWASPMWITVE